jgi:hypothetical protein
MRDFHRPGPTIDAPRGLGLNERPSEKPPRIRFSLVTFDDVLMTTTAIYRVKGLIPSVGLVVIWGPPKCGKSFWLFDLLMHVALGWTYRGLRVNPGPIVYCVLEGRDGFARRIEAFRLTHPKSKGAPFYLMHTPLDLIRDQKALIASISAQMPEGVNPAAVAIDTLNRSLVGSESSDEDMANYVRAADAINAAFDCVVPVIHHCGHNADRPRGHSSLLGAADVLIAVKRDGADNIVATVEASKDGPLGMEIVSRLLSVDIGKDGDNDIITSCVIEAVGEPSAKTAAKGAKPKSLTNGAKTALRALHMAINDLGEASPSSHVPTGAKVVTVNQWRDFAYKIGISTSQEAHAKGAAFNRASEALVAAQRIGFWDDYVWPVFQKEEK